jgi:hypothetical protein
MIPDEVSKKSGQLNVSLPPELVDVLGEIHSKHGIPPPELVRNLLSAVSVFYRENGYFAFPVHILPDREFLKNVMETTEAAELAEMAKKLPKPKRGSAA